MKIDIFDGFFPIFDGFWPTKLSCFLVVRVWQVIYPRQDVLVAYMAPLRLVLRHCRGTSDNNLDSAAAHVASMISTT
jgi:hypothetical protein